MQATIFDIQRNSFVDGPGIRTTVFFKGCNLKCEWCHNPESQKTNKQMLFYRDKCTKCGRCKDVCPNSLEKCDFCGRCEIFCPTDARKVCGKEYSVEEIFAEIKKDMSFYDNSGGGVTFSGGECMLQAEFLCEILKKCKEHGIHTAVDTAGCVAWESFEKILPYTDLFLYDIKIFDSQKHKKYTGVGNELILDNLRKLFEHDANVFIRIPIIKEVNASVDEILKIKAFLKPYKPLGTELLPYHSMGTHKYDALGIKATDFSAPDKVLMDKLKASL